ncbi:type IV pilus assembly protein PilM [Pelosinus propionicus]|uniref:Type IV pilus assembly protein PilM n=1 Tax=Pelosinus propionicus DSM 13327 TaxID=1123291 RepID=A0A1I4HD38_9FIRM|nr:type IV pilus assembly protein PilM [Pelosinus propionicus]SFL40158.1 type IV pilus assembly protein PilM [Pelosinus propionicus DSM 13327]
MWKRIQKLFLEGKQDVVGIDFGTGAIKIVEISWSKGRPVLKSFGLEMLPPEIIENGQISNSKRLTNILIQLLAKTRISSKYAVTAVGGREILARELILPVMTKEELKEAIKWEQEKYISYPPDSFYFDYSIMGRGDIESEIRVLLIASPHKTINTITSILKNAGLIPVAIEVEPLALYRTFTDAENVMIIDIGELLSQITVFQNGFPVIIRNIPLGGQRMTEVIMQAKSISFYEAEQLKKRHIDLFSLDDSKERNGERQHLELFFAEFLRDVQRTAEYYQLQNKMVSIDNVYLTGGGSQIKNLVFYLSKQLDLPVVMHDPLFKLEIPESFDRSYLQNIAPQLGAAIGLSLRGGRR